jgi:NitT/TauT family transport system substrate-binding protein
MAILTRRELLVGTSGATLGAACRSRDSGAVRVGFMTNLTHAPAIAGLASGRIEHALGMRIETRSFRAGPRVLEALVGDTIDVGVSGPAAIVYTHARHAGLLRVLSGCSSGGASFVVGKASGIRGPQDLRGKTVATAQVGTTQDISLRKYLRTHGYQPAERGGDVTVHSLDSTTILTEMSRGALDGAWLAEPWATRVVMETGAVRLVDERSLWPQGMFPTALVIARSDFMRRQPSLVPRLVAAMVDEVDRAVRAPAETRSVARDELGRLLGKKLPLPLIEEAWRFIDFTRDPLAGALDTIAEDAWALGLAPRASCRTLFV